MRKSSPGSTRVLSAFAVVAIITLITSAITPAAFAQSGARITQAIDESRVVTLAGNTRPEANWQNDRGPLADSYDIDHMMLLLRRSPQQEQALEAYIDSLNDRNSANFHRWLTPDELGETYGVSQEDIDTVTGWLEAHGFRINQIYANHMMIDFSGTAGQLRATFRADMHQLSVGGESHIANMNDPMIPAAFAPVINSIVSLHDFKPHPMYRTKTDYTTAGCSSTALPTEPGTCYAVTPADNATIYNLSPLYTGGISGQGQTVAVVEDTDSYGSDFTTYRNTFGLSTAYPSGNLQTVHPGSCSDPGANGDDGEADLDVEVATAIAPSATIELLSCPSGAVTFGGQIALQNLLNAGGPYPGVVSVSYGVCEVFNGSGGNASFLNTYQQAAAQGISVFVSSGDAGPSQCSVNFTIGSQYDVSSLGVTGWGDTPYNVSVGGTDFEDTYNSKTGQNGGAALSTYWSATNGSNYGSALKYVPEIPWNDACASALISEVATNSFTPYGASPAACNNALYDTSATYLSTGAASGGPSNCAYGSGSTNSTNYGITQPQCQGYAKPSWQSAYGVPTDNLRDTPDVSMFAANGVWGHFETVCWSDPAYTSDGSASCSGAPSTWSGFGGTSVASPTMAAIQALVNQKTGSAWGNPNPIYYQIGQSEYGTQGGSFLGSGCNSSLGSGAGCVFNDVTQGDIDLACENNGTTEEAHCYKPTGTHGVDSTDVITTATVINGGTGYTASPTCTIAGPTNNAAYLSPTGTTLYAGGSQATCTAAFNGSSTTATWTVNIASTSAAGMQIYLAAPSGSPTCGPYTLTGSSTTTIATNLVTSATGCSLINTPTRSSSTVTMTAKTTGYAGDFNVTLYPNGYIFEQAYVNITNTILGQGPGYVSSITISGGGRGYQPDTPITLTGGGGSGAIAVANTSPGTASSSYQPAYGAANGYDLATGLGSVNAYNLVNSTVWMKNSTTTSVQSSLNPSTYGQSVSFTATVTGGVNPTGTVQFNIDGSAFGSPVTLSSGSATSGSTNTLTVGTHTVTATYSGDYTNENGGSTGTLSGGQVVQAASAGVTVGLTGGTNPSNYGQSVTFTATINGQYGLTKKKPGASPNPTGTVTWSSNTGCAVSTVTGNPGIATCTTSVLPVGSDTVEADYSGDSNHNPGSGTIPQQVNQYTTTTSVQSSLNPSTYGQSVYFTASVTGGGSPTGTVQFYIDSVAYGTPVTLVSGIASSAPTTTLAQGTHTVSATYSGDTGNAGSSGSLNGGQVVQAANGEVTVALTNGNNPSSYGQSVTFTATIDGQYGLLKKHGKPLDVTGTVSWSSNTGCATTAVTFVNPGESTATCTTTALPVGSDDVVATYSGDSNHNGGSGDVMQQVVAASSTTTVMSSLDPSAYGQSVYFTATVTGNSPTGTVQFYIDMVAYGSPVTLVSGTANSAATTMLAVGTHNVTATYSGDTNNGGSSGSLSGGQMVTSAGTSVSVGSSGSPSTYGQSVTFTATITADNGLLKRRPNGHPLNITGSVTWSSNTGCGTTTVTGTYPGTATCTTSSLPVGSDTVMATYNGDSNHNSSSGSTVQVVNQVSSTTSVGSSLDPSGYGQSVYFTATVTGNNPTGTVQFYVDSVAFGGAVTLSSGSAISGSTSTLAVGTHTVTATYSGDTNNGGSSGSLSGGQMVTSAGTSVSVGSSAGGPVSYGTSVTFTATITADNGLARRRNGHPLNVTGNVTWSANTGCGTTPVSGGYPGTATCTTTTLPAGNDTVEADYLGDSNHNAASGTVGQQVTQASQTISCSGIPASAGYGSSFMASCSASSGLAVAYTSAGSCSNTGNMYTMTAPTGHCMVIANQAGNSDYSAAPQVQQSVQAKKGTATATFTGAPATAPYQTQFTVTATINDGATPTITTSAQCSISGNTVTMTTGTGTCTTTAKWPATTDYNMVTLTQHTTASKLTPVITWPTPDPITYGTALSGTQLDASASYNNQTVNGTFTYNPAAGKVLAAGTQTLNVTFKPSVPADYVTVTDSVMLVVNQQPTSTAITKTVPTAPAAGQATKVYVKVTAGYGNPTGTVTVTSDNGGPSCTVSLNTGGGFCSETFGSAGTYNLTGTYNGDSNNQTSTSASFPLTVH